MVPHQNTIYGHLLRLAKQADIGAGVPQATNPQALTSSSAASSTPSPANAPGNDATLARIHSDLHKPIKPPIHPFSMGDRFSRERSDMSDWMKSGSYQLYRIARTLLNSYLPFKL